MKILVINGPNLNMLGIREKHLYGSLSYEKIVQLIMDEGKKRNIAITCLQSNYEGDLVSWIQEAYFENYDGIIINPGAYTHTSIALLDAIKAVAPLPVVEVHLTDTDKREAFRKQSYMRTACIATIKGHQQQGYIEAMDIIVKHLEDSKK
ncbi:MAG: type II 3-dehydroquinate dehydratase [Erysipelotrichaceae bacterium]|nr:type II 3-dehydroquinate dehydratase [Erysipelotrichaceae bacterium]MDY5252630.1 type II 3-dehydroquinate dehydratase [Erysipelotrichaceae bacterium]